MLVLPVVLCQTVFSSIAVYILMGNFLLAFGLTLLVRQRANGQGVPRYAADLRMALGSSRKLFVTHSRASLMILTCVAILAVDFHIFPRRFVKTETFGTGLMDVGVGAFVASGGTVGPLARRGASGAATTDSAPGVTQTLVKCIPIFVLGFLRLFSTSAVDYQKHVSEYGVHWNFSSLSQSCHYWLALNKYAARNM